MTAYEDIAYTVNATEDTSTACYFCSADCSTSLLSEGCCPHCASLLATMPAARVTDDKTALRAKLFTLTQEAYASWGEAVRLLTERQTAIRPSQSCIEEAAQLASHRARRYALLETRLAAETGMDSFSVLNRIAAA